MWRAKYLTWGISGKNGRPVRRAKAPPRQHICPCNGRWLPSIAPAGSPPAASAGVGANSKGLPQPTGADREPCPCGG
jgi:hypothetical protein